MLILYCISFNIIMPKYKPAFLRDYDFYLHNSKQFNYPYDNIPDIVYNPNGLDAKACFWFFDSQGILKDCKEPEVLKKILICKKSVFFHIKSFISSR